LMNIK